MAFQIRAVIVSVIVDEIDADGNVIREHSTDPVKVFPVQFATIGPQAFALADRLTHESATPPKAA